MNIYKLVSRAAWETAQLRGRYEGSTRDVADGFLHFSTGAQLQETARKHYRGQTDLVALTLVADELGPELRFEPSRGGELFPHLYRDLVISEVKQVVSIPLDDVGVPMVPDTLVQG
jgi:uncharacterized protein (DUF952 family)